jgi:hypothetical protein
MTATEDAALLGWVRVEPTGFPRVYWKADDGTGRVYAIGDAWRAVVRGRQPEFPTEDAALSAAIDATPYARALLEARREIATYRRLAEEGARKVDAAKAALGVDSDCEIVPEILRLKAPGAM